MSSSIGIAICPNDGTDRQALLSHADTALYKAKMEGRGTYRFFEAAMGAQVRDRRHLEHDLRHAISRRELSLVYQPQKDIKTNEIVGFEALLRWQPRRSRRAFRPRYSYRSRKRAARSFRLENGCYGLRAMKPRVGPVR